MYCYDGHFLNSNTKIHFFQKKQKIHCARFIFCTNFSTASHDFSIGNTEKLKKIPLHRPPLCNGIFSPCLVFPIKSSHKVGNYAMQLLF